MYWGDHSRMSLSIGKKSKIKIGKKSSLFSIYKNTSGSSGWNVGRKMTFSSVYWTISGRNGTLTIFDTSCKPWAFTAWFFDQSGRSFTGEWGGGNLQMGQITPARKLPSKTSGNCLSIVTNRNLLRMYYRIFPLNLTVLLNTGCVGTHSGKLIFFRLTPSLLIRQQLRRKLFSQDFLGHTS